VASLRIDLARDLAPFSLAAYPGKHNATTVIHASEYFLKDITLLTFLHLRTHPDDHGDTRPSLQLERNPTKLPRTHNPTFFIFHPLNDTTKLRALKNTESALRIQALRSLGTKTVQLQGKQSSDLLVLNGNLRNCQPSSQDLRGVFRRTDAAVEQQAKEDGVNAIALKRSRQQYSTPNLDEISLRLEVVTL
jgi:hypothetical protein